MSEIIVFLKSISMEQIRTFASIIQALGVFVAAFLVFWLGKRLEHHKYDIRKKEIMFSKLQDKRLEAIESIGGLLGKILYETKGLVESGKVYRFEGPREAYLSDIFKAKKNAITASTSELEHFENRNFVYLGTQLYERLIGFGISIDTLVEHYCKQMLESGKGSAAYSRLCDDGIARHEQLRREAWAIIDSFKANIEAEMRP